MHKTWRSLTSLVLVASASLIALGGCVVSSRHPNQVSLRHPNQVWDPFYEDHHQWDNDENRRYESWERSGRRGHHDFSRRNADEQKQYWNWRHSGSNDGQHGQGRDNGNHRRN